LMKIYTARKEKYDFHVPPMSYAVLGGNKTDRHDM
jgi:hypothetical protein